MVAHNADVVCVKCVNEFVVIARARQGGQEPGPAAQPEDTQALRKKHLKTLGLTPDSSWTEVQSTYRDLVKKNHPDKHPDGQKREDATAKMSKINEAYSWLLARREAA
jgi:DnaJ-domain-containing protein 1